MRLYHYLLIFVLPAIIACSGHRLPDGVLPAKKMIPILVDIHLSEAINNQKFNISLVRDSLPEELYLSVCRKHKIERSVIEKSLLYYGKHPGEYTLVYDEVLDVLNAMEVKSKNDTLRAARVGGFDLDTSKTKKSLPAEVKDAPQKN
ncbi:MAG: DUF4296 domain-containing protein [Prolixibacteraceae bacterium]|jgi:hypothetical protein|nr:DUF4296 domain-containing protein [Prolixibacteraceae bacterium]